MVVVAALRAWGRRRAVAEAAVVAESCARGLFIGRGKAGKRGRDGQPASSRTSLNGGGTGGGA